MAHKHPRPEGPCPNCGHQLQPDDRFCSRCGQENHDLKVPISHLVYELIEGFWHFDNKFFRTLWTSVRRPGQVVLDFLEGRRARYVPPVRLYIFVSVIFFFLLHKCGEGSNSGNLRFNSGTNGKAIEVHTDQGAKEEEADAGPAHTNGRDSQIGLGMKVLSQRGAWIESTSKQPQLVFEERIGRIGFAGVEVSADQIPSESSYSIQCAVFLKTMERIMAAAPETRAKKNWEESLKKALKVYKEELEDDDGDTLYVNRTLPGKVRLVYQPRFGRIPSDSLSALSYLNIDTRAEMDSLLEHYHQEPSFFHRLVLERMLFLYTSVLDGRADHLLEDYWVPVFWKDLSISMFLLMPAAGFFLLIFFYTRRKYYYEHLIFSIYSHSLVFLLFSFAMLVQMLCNATVLETAADFLFALTLISLPLYFFLSLRRVYHQGWGLTALKGISLLTIYLLFLFLLTLGIVVVSFATFH